MMYRLMAVCWMGICAAPVLSGQYFPQGDAAWQGFSSSIAGTDTFQQALCGDTLIGGQQYQQLLSVTATDTVFAAGLRVNGPRIFFVRPGEESGHLLYDFSLQPGDEVELQYVEEPGEVTLKVASVVEVNGRKHLNFVPMNGLQEVWVEGVGSIYGPLKRGFLFPSLYSELECFWENGELTYRRVETTQCSFFFECQTLSTAAAPSMVPAHLYPTLNEGQAYLQHWAATPLRAQLYSPAGQLLRTWEQLLPGTHELHFTGLPAGMYLLRLQEPDKPLSLRHFKFIIVR